MSKCDSHLIFEALEKRPGVSIDEGLIFDLENIAWHKRHVLLVQQIMFVWCAISVNIKGDFKQTPMNIRKHVQTLNFHDANTRPLGRHGICLNLLIYVCIYIYIYTFIGVAVTIACAPPLSRDTLQTVLPRCCTN